jgi:hypothetical protein
METTGVLSCFCYSFRILAKDDIFNSASIYEEGRAIKKGLNFQTNNFRNSMLIHRNTIQVRGV